MQKKDALLFWFVFSSLQPTSVQFERIGTALSTETQVEFPTLSGPNCWWHFGQRRAKLFSLRKKNLRGKVVSLFVKQVVQIALGVLVAGMLLWWMIDPDGFRHKMWGYSQKEIDQSWQQVHEDEQRVSGRSDEPPDQSGTKITYGDAADSAYRTCHDGTPKTKKQERDCARLEKKVAAP